ncbi:hypothetical protein YC2023_089601 [Brassica napus]
MSGGEPTKEVGLSGCRVLVTRSHFFVDLVLSPSLSISTREESSSCSKRRIAWVFFEENNVKELKFLGSFGERCELGLTLGNDCVICMFGKRVEQWRLSISFWRHLGAFGAQRR